MKRKRRHWARLKRRSGESLGEVLISVLIAAVALVLLASMITASAGLTERSRERLKGYYTDQQRLTFEGEPDDTANFTATIREDGNPVGGVAEAVRIDLYIENGPGSAEIYAYRAHQEGGDAP